VRLPQLKRAKLHRPSRRIVCYNAKMNTLPVVSSVRRLTGRDRAWISACSNVTNSWLNARDSAPSVDIRLYRAHKGPDYGFETAFLVLKMALQLGKRL
jgi:hypothetical protein